MAVAKKQPLCYYKCNLRIEAYIGGLRKGEIMSKEQGFYHEIIETSKRMPVQVILHAESLDFFVLEHWHRSIELDYILNCRGRFWVNGKEKYVSEQSMVLINSGDIHALEPVPMAGAKPLYGASIFIAYEFLKEICPEIDSYLFVLEGSEEKLEELKEIYRKIIRLHQAEQSSFHYLEMNGLVYQMLYLLFTYFRQERSAASVKSQKYMERLRSVMEYMESSYREPLTLQEVASHFSISREYLARDFHKYTGSTFKEYLNKIRIGKAYEALMTTDLNMLDIALDNGFPDVRSFIKVFKEVYGMTPFQYKKERALPDSRQGGTPLEGYPHIVCR